MHRDEVSGEVCILGEVGWIGEGRGWEGLFVC